MSSLTASYLESISRIYIYICMQVLKVLMVLKVEVQELMVLKVGVQVLMVPKIEVQELMVLKVIL